MSIFLSPGVYTRERDISTIVPNLSSTIGAVVGYSEKGDINDIKLLTNSQQFIDEYGKPPAGSPNTYFHYSALAFLEKGNRLYALRVANAPLYGGEWIIKPGGAGANTVLTVGRSSQAFTTVGGQDILFYIFAVDPGVWNNSISIKIPTASIIGAPATPGAISYQFNIEVYTKDSDGNYTQQEVWTVSRQHKSDGYGRQMNFVDKINGFSNYIFVADNPDTVLFPDTMLPTPQDAYLDMGGGDSGTAPTDGQLITGWELFANPDDIDIRILINAGNTTLAVQQKMRDLAEARADCVAVLDIPYAQLTSVTAMTLWRTGVQNFNSSYCALYTPWVKIYDSYNDKIVEVPPSGYVAAQFAYNDYVAEPWYAPAGFNRGLLNVLGLTNVFTQGERDSLYEVQINPLQTFRGEGTVVWGQKMEKSVPSALDRVNVRRLLITLEKAMAVALRGYCFEPNTEVTRLRVSTMLEQYLDLLSARGAFQTELGDKGYRVVCDTNNNTPATIDANELHVDVFLKPVRAAEIIQLQAIITQTGASFEELIARGVMF